MIALSKDIWKVHHRNVEYAIVAFILLIGPLSMLLGTDSRDLGDRRGWWPGVFGERWSRLISRSPSRVAPRPRGHRHSGSTG
jgi:hypothetical protein